MCIRDRWNEWLAYLLNEHSMITRPKSKCFLFIVYNRQKRCHFIACVFFLLFISCNGTPSSSNIEVNSHHTKASKGVEKDGEVIIYHRNGKPQSVGHFVKGVAHGPIIVYDSNGHELYRGLFTNGKPSGEWVFTNPKNHEKTIKSY